MEWALMENFSERYYNGAEVDFKFYIIQFIILVMIFMLWAIWKYWKKKQKENDYDNW